MNKIMELAEGYARCYGYVSDEDLSSIRSTLEAAVQAQADEIGRLKTVVDGYKADQVEGIEISVKQQAEIERLNERMIEADASIDRLEKAEREIGRLTASPFSEEAYEILQGENRMLRAKLDAATKVPLTDKKIDKLWIADNINKPQMIVRRQIARAIEAAHNIKGTTL